MKTKIEFDAFCEEEFKKIAAQITAMHTPRKQANKKYSFKKYGRNVLILFLLMVSVAVSGIILGDKAPKILVPLSFITMPVFFFYTVIAPIVILVKRNTVIETLDNKYKTELIPQLLKILFPELKYEPGKGLLSEECKFQTFVYKEYSSGFKSEDLISGSVNGHAFRMADVKYLYKSRGELRTGVGSKDSVYGAYAIFKSPVNFPFSLNTYQPYSALQPLKDLSDTITDTIKKVPEPIYLLAASGPLHKKAITLEKIRDKIKVGHTEFDRVFHIHSDNEEAAKKLLTHELMDRIVHDVESVKFCMNIALYGNEIHFAFPFLNMFEFSLGAITTDEKDEKLTTQYIKAIWSMVEIYGQLIQNGAAVKVNDNP